MAYLTGTITGPDGKAIALKGFIMNSDMRGWTKHPRRIEWPDVIKTWRRQPSIAEVQKTKRRLPIAPST